MSTGLQINRNFNFNIDIDLAPQFKHNEPKGPIRSDITILYAFSNFVSGNKRHDSQQSKIVPFEKIQLSIKRDH